MFWSKKLLPVKKNSDLLSTFSSNIYILSSSKTIIYDATHTKKTTTQLQKKNLLLHNIFKKIPFLVFFNIHSFLHNVCALFKKFKANFTVFFLFVIFMLGIDCFHLGREFLKISYFSVGNSWIFYLIV